MLPQNFPARINARRQAALARIENQLTLGTKRTSRGEVPLTTGDRSRLQREGDALAMSLRPEAQLRAIWTKKTRADGWSPEREFRQRGRISR